MNPGRTAIAYRYRCARNESPLCDRGDGAIRPKARCRHCRGPIVTESGQWGVFEWTGHGRYELEAAVRTFAARPLADDWAEARNLVVRFVPDVLPPPQEERPEDAAPAPPAEAKVIDLMAALEASVRDAREARRRAAESTHGAS